MLISQLMDEATFHVDPSPAVWVGSHLIQVEVGVVSTSGNSTVAQCWLIDPNLPKNMFSLEKRKHVHASASFARICECELVLPCTNMLIPGDRVACQAQLSGFDLKRVARVHDPNEVWHISRCDITKPIKFVHLFCGAFHGWSQAIRYLEERCTLFKTRARHPCRLGRQHLRPDC